MTSAAYINELFQLKQRHEQLRFKALKMQDPAQKVILERKCLALANTQRFIKSFHKATFSNRINLSRGRSVSAPQPSSCLLTERPRYEQPFFQPLPRQKQRQQQKQEQEQQSTARLRAGTLPLANTTNTRLGLLKTGPTLSRGGRCSSAPQLSPPPCIVVAASS